MTHQAGELLVNEIAPRLRITSRCLPQVGADDADELYQDGLAIAAGMLESAERNGKQAGRDVTAGNIAWYAGKHLATGRRSTFGGRTDVLCPAAQLDGRSRLTSLEQEAVRNADSGEGVESAPLSDLLADEAEDPAQAAARNLDWEQFLSGLDDLSRRMVLTFARGETMRDLKDEAGLSDSGMSSRKRRLIAEMKEVLGPDCLADASREPAWRSDVAAQREKDACRHQITEVAGV